MKPTDKQKEKIYMGLSFLGIVFEIKILMIAPLLGILAYEYRIAKSNEYKTLQNILLILGIMFTGIIFKEIGYFKPVFEPVIYISYVCFFISIIIYVSCIGKEIKNKNYKEISQYVWVPTVLLLTYGLGNYLNEKKWIVFMAAGMILLAITIGTYYYGKHKERQST